MGRRRTDFEIFQGLRTSILRLSIPKGKHILIHGDEDKGITLYVSDSGHANTLVSIDFFGFEIGIFNNEVTFSGLKQGNINELFPKSFDSRKFVRKIRNVLRNEYETLEQERKEQVKLRMQELKKEMDELKKKNADVA